MENVLKFLESRKICFIREFIPYYVVSTCCHLVNLANKKNQFYMEGGTIPDMRLHMFFVSPAGFSKSFILKVLLGGPTSALGGTELKTTYSGNVTEAGFTGTIRATDDTGDPVITYGAAHDYADFIVGIEEFSALTTAMKQEHSSNLDNALLTALDSGHLVKRLAAGEIRYDTDITLFAASQPTRFDLSSGLGRRFFFVNFIPSLEEKEKLKQCRRGSKGVRGDMRLLKQIGQDVTSTMKKIEGLKSVKFTDAFMKAIDNLKVPHYIEPLFERLGVGYAISTTDFNSILKVDITPELQKYMGIAKEWRTQISRGAEEQQVVRVLEAGEMEELGLKDELLDFGLQYGKSEELIGRLVKQKRVKREEGKVCLIG